MKKILSVILLVVVVGCEEPEAANLQSGGQGLHIFCEIEQTKFAVGQKLPAPKVKIHNDTRADADLIGPTSTVIECTLVQPDKETISMCIAMPTGRDPRDMPSRKLMAGRTIELKADGIWYFNKQIGYEPYIFRREGTYKFSCKYEELNSNIINITVSNAYPGPDDIKEFRVDTLAAGTHFRDFKVERKDLEEVLSKWHRVSEEHWRHGYSHVAFGDRTGTIKLNDGSAVGWMVRPGGLAALTFQDGTVLCLAKELTPWKKQSESAEEKMKAAYTFLLRKVQEDGINLIASENDKNPGLIQNIIQTKKLNIEVESYRNLERRPSLSYYSRSTRQTVTIIDVSKRTNSRYYVSYYIGPEGGASKEIIIENKNGKWMVADDDDMWSVK